MNLYFPIQFGNPSFQFAAAASASAVAVPAAAPAFAMLIVLDVLADPLFPILFAHFFHW